MKKTTLQLEDLACPSCSQKIEQALKNTKGVESADILFNSSKAKISYDENETSPEKLSMVIEDIGYDVLNIL